MTNKLRSSLAIILFATIAYIGAFDFDSASAATISMTTSGAQSIDVMPDSSSNVGTNIGVDNINVVTDCRAGYNLSMSASVSDNNLYLNGNSSNNQSGTYFSPANGTSTLANSPNTWGYLLSDTTPTSSSVFSAVPTNANPAVLKTTATTTSASNINDSFNVYFGVAMNNSLAPGIYKMIPDTNNSNADGSITYYLTMDTSCETRTITYNANNGSGSISPQVVQSGSSVVLADNAFTRNNYYFKGWATSSGGSVAYRPSQTITPTGDMTLYAVWGNSTTTTLYNAVASLTRGNQTNNTNATTGIQTNPTKATSGVYTYNASVFGTSSDSANTSAIYYYRGILDTNLDGTSSTYGSNGNSMNYPNYVRLGDTCWRIVRTTGSGGVKMIYNGLYGNTTSGSCANAQAAAAIRATSATTATSTATFTSAFAGTSAAQYRSIVGVGYTRNNTYASTSATTATAYSTLFGTNSSYSGNSTNSTIKGNIETWFTNNLNSYASKLEPSAGYCNDRSIRSSGSSTSLIADSTTIVPYSTSSVTAYYFGPSVRNTTDSDKPTLTCPRSTVDLYTTSSASNGNKQLSKPVALLTADEMSFAGSGSTTATQGSGYNSNSYLRSGSFFWLLSPNIRSSDGGSTYGFTLSSNGTFYNSNVGNTNGVRPAISLKSGTTIASGSGTATSPWVISMPPIYDIVAGMSKGTQTNDTNATTGIKVSPTAPTNSATVSANSGVYEYNSSVFGADTDGTKSDNTKATIYYYRGILDSYGNTGTYGSNGLSDAYPNYVILQSGSSKATTDTCWRIIRTTGSGGVKMIYNGLWTGSTCANAQDNTQLSATSTFNGTASTASIARQIVRVGYTHNSTYAGTSTTTGTAFDTVFGSNSTYSVNNTNSTIKDNVETWYNSTISGFGSLFESNAGFCNDRYSFTTATGTTATTSIRPYTTNTSNTGATYVAYFAGSQRNAQTAKAPSLGCSSGRTTVDIYSTDTSKGGNGQLSAPVGLLTADEASFAGSGRTTAGQGSGYNANSYLRTGNTYWTMTPYYRTGSYAYNFYMVANGYVNYGRIDTAYGVRPVVSLKEGTTPASGSGIATDPFVIRKP